MNTYESQNHIQSFHRTYMPCRPGRIRSYRSKMLQKRETEHENLNKRKVCRQGDA